MKKLIKTNDGIKEMGFNEVLRAHENFLHSKSNIKIGVGINSIEKEDLFQELQIVAWKCYDMYDINSNCNFITLLNKLVTNHIRILIRKSKDKEEYLTMGDEYDIFDKKGKLDSYFEDDYDLVSSICRNKEEEDMLKVIISDEPKSRIAKRMGVSRTMLYKKIRKYESIFKERIKNL